MADQYEDLVKAADSVRVAVFDERAQYLIAREIPPGVDLVRSHYTLALFERDDGRSWYILDGYYQMSSGDILFMDVVYDPSDGWYRHIENYQPFVPYPRSRYLLKATEVCNPYDRHFIGIMEADFYRHSLDRFRDLFREQFGRYPEFVFTGATLYLHDAEGTFGDSPAFTLSEEEFAGFSRQHPELPEFRIIGSGRAKSDEVLRQTYVPVGDSCPDARHGP